MERKGKKSKGKAGGGDRYDVMLSGGGDQMKCSTPDLERHRCGAPRSHSGPRQHALKRAVTRRASSNGDQGTAAFRHREPGLVLA